MNKINNKKAAYPGMPQPLNFDGETIGYPAVTEQRENQKVLANAGTLVRTLVP